MNKNTREHDLIRLIRSGKRLKTKPPKRETPKTVYSRKSKHKRRMDDSSFFLYGSLLFNLHWPLPIELNSVFLNVGIGPPNHERGIEGWQKTKKSGILYLRSIFLFRCADNKGLALVYDMR